MAQPPSSILSGEELKQNSCAISLNSLLSRGEGGKVGIATVEHVVWLKSWTGHVLPETCLVPRLEDYFSPSA
jgi:hypothetical protein